jgi:hypothetical protein
MTFFIVTAVNTSNLTIQQMFCHFPPHYEKENRSKGRTGEGGKWRRRDYSKDAFVIIFKEKSMHFRFRL